MSLTIEEVRDHAKVIQDTQRLPNKNYLIG
jgi:hypothetical protein